MIDSVVFVHGTGVRKASYDKSAAKVLAALRGKHFGGHFEPCLWGEKYGARLAKDGRSIPDFAGVAQAKPDDEAYLALWSLLADDPYFELRQLRSEAARPPLVPPAALAELAALPDRLRGLARQPKVIAALGDAAEPAVLAAALDTLAGADALLAALQSAARVDTALRQGAARAAVALLLAPGDDAVWLGAERRDALVAALVDGLGGVEMGAVTDWVRKRLEGLGKRIVVKAIERRRDLLYNGAYPLAGDILLYQARGENIRAHIAERIDACKGKVALIAHSLGGIACVDLLVTQPRPQVELLVTVGSQAPLLYELGALHGFPAPGPLPAHFPPRWINFYDPDDLLSYRAAPVFDPASPKMEVRDIELRSREPFPISHSAYWGSTTLWDRLADYLTNP
jgi:hypothetical protein